jgi:histidyl-tRNA synthetase
MREVIEMIIEKDELFASESVKAGLADMNLLASHLEAMGIATQVTFNLSLARRLDYYTGLIYEVMPKDIDNSFQVGSIAAGGRYDNLVGVQQNIYSLRRNIIRGRSNYYTIRCKKKEKCE